MKKFTLLCLSPLVLAPLAFAGGKNEPVYAHGNKPHHHVDRPFTGLYVMGGMGGMIAGLETTQSALGNLTGEALSVSNDADLFQSNVAGLLGIGYLYQFENGVVMGAFATAGATDIEFENKTMGGASAGPVLLPTTTQLRTSVDYDFALLIKPGFTLGKRTLFYGLLGPRWGHFNTSYQAGMDVTLSSGSEFVELNVNAEGDVSQYALGFTAGVGMAQLLTPHLMFGLEYTYTGYGEFDPLNIEGSGELLFCDTGCESSPGTISGSTTIEPNINTVMATLSYRFH